MAQVEILPALVTSSHPALPSTDIPANASELAQDSLLEVGFDYEPGPHSHLDDEILAVLKDARLALDRFEVLRAWAAVAVMGTLFAWVGTRTRKEPRVKHKSE